MILGLEFGDAGIRIWTYLNNMFESMMVTVITMMSHVGFYTLPVHGASLQQGKRKKVGCTS